MHNKIYTGIGSRETPTEVLVLMAKIAITLANHGWTLRSGHAPGADQAFETGVRRCNGPMEIYLPWPGFENAPARDSRYLYIESHEAEHVACEFHPNWAACSPGAKKLHTRNVFQVAGKDLNSRSDMIICWTKGGKRDGGTGQALRIAEYLEIPIFDLAICQQKEILDFINHGIL